MYALNIGLHFIEQCAYKWHPKKCAFPIPFLCLVGDQSTETLVAYLSFAVLSFLVGVCVCDVSSRRLMFLCPLFIYSFCVSIITFFPMILLWVFLGENIFLFIDDSWLCLSSWKISKQIMRRSWYFQNWYSNAVAELGINHRRGQSNNIFFLP
jgi:hypothetical protein